MSKPTLFFSHSSKDKDLILLIKQKIDKVTSGTMDIFMSSDGQSIPFGRNWVHKIEEGLQAAQIMFLFVTDNSIKSGWIYFEAGYAYSKGIQVIPVGIGIDVGQIKTPLNLLQGFNINSTGSLNNFISIINSNFSYHFEDSFDEIDYSEIIKYVPHALANYVSIEDICAYEEYRLWGEYHNQDGSIISYDIDKYFDKIIAYFDNNNIQYSIENRDFGQKMTCVVAQGIYISYYRKREKQPDSLVNRGESAKIAFRISPYNFGYCFSTLTELMKLQDNIEMKYIKMYFRRNIECIIAEENISSIISIYPDEFKADKEHIGWYDNTQLGLSFSLLKDNETDRNRSPLFAICVQYDCSSTEPLSIVRLINRLCEIKLIRLSSDIGKTN